MLGRAITVTILLMAFIVFDLYYGFSDTTCVNQSTGSIDVGMWLKVDAFTDVSCLLVFYILALLQYRCRIMSKQNVGWSLWWIMFCYCLFKIAWLIVGSVIYWENMAKTGLCSSSLSSYMSARLGLGFFLYLLMPCLVFIVDWDASKIFAK